MFVLEPKAKDPQGLKEGGLYLVISNCEISPVTITTPTGNNPGWICDCRQLYLTQELDLLCMGIVVVLTKELYFLVTKKYKTIR